MKNSAFKPRTLNIQVNINISLTFYFLFQITKFFQEKLKDKEKNNHLEKKKK